MNYEKIIEALMLIHVICSDNNCLTCPFMINIIMNVALRILSQMNGILTVLKIGGHLNELL